MDYVTITVGPTIIVALTITVNPVSSLIGQIRYPTEKYNNSAFATRRR